MNHHRLGGRRKRRPHPARRARRIVGATGTVSLLLLSGYMAVDARQSTSAFVVTGSAAARSDADAEEGSYAAATPITVTASTPATRPDTSSNGS